MLLSESPFPRIDQLPALGTGSDLLSDGSDGPADRQQVEHEAGFDQGYEDGLAAGRAALDATVAALESALHDLRQRHATELDALTSDAVELAMNLAEVLVGHDLAQSSDPGRDGLIRALSIAPSREDAVAYLHPDDLAVLGDIADLTAGRTIALHPDPSLVRGDCVLEVGSSRIDSQISDAIERVRSELTAAPSTVSATVSVTDHAGSTGHNLVEQDSMR